MEASVRPSSGFNLPRYLSMQPLFQEMERSELERLAAGCTLRRHGRGIAAFDNHVVDQETATAAILETKRTVGQIVG